MKITDLSELIVDNLDIPHGLFKKQLIYEITAFENSGPNEQMGDIVYENELQNFYK